MAGKAKDELSPRAKAWVIGVLIVLFGAWWAWASFLDKGDPDEPSADEVLEMDCDELQRFWQSHRRGEWDAPGTFDLLADQIEERC